MSEKKLTSHCQVSSLTSSPDSSPSPGMMGVSQVVIQTWTFSLSLSFSLFSSLSITRLFSVNDVESTVDTRDVLTTNAGTGANIIELPVHHHHLVHAQGGGGGGAQQQQQQANDPTKSVQWQITTSLAQATANKVSTMV